ncbi:MAG: hypothetical protein WC822_06820 [Candidatus Paceibacterota bacterium]|jgi:hypothetical protein
MVAPFIKATDFHDERMALAFSCCRHMKKIDMWAMAKATGCVVEGGWFFWFKECYMGFIDYEQREFYHWQDRRYDYEDYTYREKTAPEIVVPLAKKIHAVATLRRIWGNWEKIARVAFYEMS